MYIFKGIQNFTFQREEDSRTVATSLFFNVNLFCEIRFKKLDSYLNIKGKNLVCAMNDGMRTILSDQVQRRATSNVVGKRLVRVCFKTFKTSILEKFF